MKKILILGGSSDIGKSLVNKILKLDYQIDLHCNKSIPKKLVKYKKVKIIKCDFTKYKNSDMKKFSSKYDVIINLVGLIDNNSFSNFTLENLIKSIKVNSLIPLNIIRNSLKHMKKKKFGRIINTTSVGTKFGGGRNTFNYSLSKFLNEFIPNEIREISKYNIYYNVLNIGVTKTKMHKKISNKNLKKRTMLIPIKKMANPDDISNYIVFLIKDNNFISNSIIDITGGE